MKERALEYAASAREVLSEGTDKVKTFVVNEPARALGIALGLGGPPGMANQASVNLDGSPVNQPEGVVGNITEFGNDVMTLVELQAQLAALDFKAAMARATIPLVLIAVGLALLLASLPVALLGIAALVARAFSMNVGWATLLTAAVAAIVAAIVAVVALKRFLGSLDSFRHSREELVRNIAWIRTVLVHSGRSIPRGRF